MSTITFSESEERKHQKFFSRPLYSINFYTHVNGVKLFLTQLRRVTHHTRPESGYKKNGVEQMQQSLIKSKGLYAHKDQYDDPYDLLQKIENGQLIYSSAQYVSIYKLEGGYEVTGSLLINGQDFHYRFFSLEAVTNWINQAVKVCPTMSTKIGTDDLIYP